jgi:hypothetical protein
MSASDVDSAKILLRQLKVYADAMTEEEDDEIERWLEEELES